MEAQNGARANAAVTAHYEILYTGPHDEEWLRLRRESGVGASESPTLTGLSKRASPEALYAQKLGALAVEETEEMVMGRELEGTILRLLRKDTGWGIEPSGLMLRSARWPALTCTLDGMDYSNDRRPVQIKATSLRDEWEDGPPPHVWAQEQHEMAVTGAKTALVGALVASTRLRWAVVERDDAYIEGLLVPTVERFWRAVQAHEPYYPDLSGPPEDVKRALAALFPVDLGQTVHLDGRFVALHERRLALKSQLNAVEMELGVVENEFRAAIGEATHAVLPNRVTYSLKTTEVAEATITRKAYSFRALRHKEPK